MAGHPVGVRVGTCTCIKTCGGHMGVVAMEAAAQILAPGHTPASTASGHLRCSAPTAPTWAKTIGHGDERGFLSGEPTTANPETKGRSSATLGGEEHLLSLLLKLLSGCDVFSVALLLPEGRSTGECSHRPL